MVLKLNKWKVKWLLYYNLIHDLCRIMLKICWFKVRTQSELLKHTLFSFQLFLLSTSHCSPWPQRHSHHFDTDFIQWLGLSGGTYVSMRERGQKMKVWHVTPEVLLAAHSAHQWRALTSNSLSAAREGYTGKQSSTLGLLILSKSSPFIQNYKSSTWVSSYQTFQIFCLTAKVLYYCCHMKCLLLWARVNTAMCLWSGF